MRATLVNASAAQTSIAVWAAFGRAPDDRPVAWLSALLAPASFTVFEWQAVYDFVWADTGQLVPGKTLSAAQHLPAASVGNAARLQQQGLDYRLVPATPPSPPAPGELLLSFDGSIPPNRLAAGISIRIASGIGQPGSGTSVVQAQPNLNCLWSTGERYYANSGSITQFEYDPPAFGVQAPLPLDFSAGPEIVVMLDEANVLQQLGASALSQLMRSGSFVEVPPGGSRC